MVSKPMSVHLHSVEVKRRGKTILGPIDLSLDASGFTIVLGPNGAGKTTLLKVLHGVERVSKGAVEWSVASAEARQSQAYVFQNPIMLRRSVAHNLAYPLELLGTAKAQIELHVNDWAGRIGLTNALNQSAVRLSGGEKQKLALARALIREPRVLFLDEPCANLDGRATREIEQLLRDAVRAGTRIIMTMHNLGQARRLATDVVFLLNGKLCEQGSADQFFTNPQAPEALAFQKGDIVE